MDWAITILVLLIIAAVINLLIESVYFIRVGICYLLARFGKRKVHILEKCSISGEAKWWSWLCEIFTRSFISGICTTTDVDMILTHMNNARYLREVDLARIDFYIRSGLYNVVRSQNGQILLGSANVRFRKLIGLFARFKITTKIAYWNDDSIFIEHRFIGKNGLIHATLLCQQRLVNCSGEIVMEILLKQGSTILPKPEMPIEVSCEVC